MGPGGGKIEETLIPPFAFGRPKKQQKREKQPEKRSEAENLERGGSIIRKRRGGVYNWNRT